MANSSRIFWFSGTGNSLYAAKRLSAALSNIPIEQMTTAPPSGSIGGEGEKIGFVFPSYYGNLPRAVRTFVQNLQIRPGTYIFAIVTMGALGQGSVGALDKALQAKGFTLHFGRGVKMPANCVIKYNPSDPENKDNALRKVDERLLKFAAQISTGAQSVKTLPITSNNLYSNIEALDAAFAATDNCTGCGLCQKICPVENIRLMNGRPKWLHHCEHCVACISWCPAKAIQYGNLTQSRRRYRNPKIQVSELARK